MTEVESAAKIAGLELELKKRQALLSEYSRVLDELLDEARTALEPYGKRQGRRKIWWEGYFQGVLGAECMLAPVYYPGVELNKEFVHRAYTAAGIPLTAVKGH